MSKENLHENTVEKIPDAILVFVGDDFEEGIERRLDELSELLSTAGGREYSRLIQIRPLPDNATALGKGKLLELKEICENAKIELVVFDNELSPSQIRNIEQELTDVRVIDRTMLILDIFAQNATTGEGILQVKLAHLQYTIPRLRGKGTSMSRLGGGIGTRGPGETKLETERRHIKERMTSLKEELREMENQRRVRREARDSSGIVKIAVAGYTNVGKSTLLNTLTGADILAENKLFATLDPTTRRWTLPNAGEVVLTDTVGFINNLPHHLVEAFKSTLSEVVFSDIIFVVLDISHPEVRLQLEVTEEIIASLCEKNGVENKPTLYIFNKIDKVEGIPETVIGMTRKNAVFISAKTGEGLNSLIEKTEQIIGSLKKETKFVLPHSRAGLLDSLYRESNVVSVEYTDSGIEITAQVNEKILGRLREYIVEE